MLLFIVTVFLLLIGQKARNSGSDWFVQLSVSRCLIQHFVIGRRLISDFAVRLRINRVLNEPVRFEEIVFFILSIVITGN